MFSATVYAPAAYAAMAGMAGAREAQPVRVNRMIRGIRIFIIVGSLLHRGVEQLHCVSFL